MRRGLLVLAVALAFAVPAAASPAPPRASLQHFICQQATNPLNRAIQVVGVMRPRTGTQHMEMKFVLQQRSASGGVFSAVQADRWHQSALGQRPGDVWKLKRFVANLAAPYVYRFRVSFRWLGASGTPLKHTVLFSSLCYQPQ
jgi:hypothetical protein